MVASHRLTLKRLISFSFIAASWPAATASSNQKKPTRKRSEPLPQSGIPKRFDKGGMCRLFTIRQSGWQGVRARSRTPIADVTAFGHPALRHVERKIRLFAANQFKIDFSQDFGIEKRAVQCPRRVVDPEPATQRIKRCWRSGKSAPGDCQRINRLIHWDHGPPDPGQLRIEEFHVEG